METTLFDLAKPMFRPAGALTQEDHRERAEAWIAEHPDVYALFERFAGEMALRGRKFGVKALAERVRWECEWIKKDDEADWKINNNHVAYIARRLVQDHPQLKDFVEFRKVDF